MPHRAKLAVALALALLAVTVGACGKQGPELTVYSGRSEELVGPLLNDFADQTGIDIAVRYGDTAALASAIIEEGKASPADVFFAQDAGALGAVSAEGLFSTLPVDVIDQVPGRFRAADRTWVGTSGRSRVLVYNPDAISEDELPASVLDLTDPKWKGKVGWAPTNGSFQAFVTALRVMKGDDTARSWLKGMLDNDVVEFSSNIAIVQAVSDGEIELGLVNHYYVPQMKSENPKLKAALHFFEPGDPGALVNSAGVAMLRRTDQPAEARRLVEFLLSKKAQDYFADETYEYPLVKGVPADASLPALSELRPPSVDLADLSDLRGTLDLLEEVGAL